MKPKFTPAPWKVGKVGSVVTQTPDSQVDMSLFKMPIDNYDWRDTFTAYGGHVICETITTANAELVATAPEMYDLLERFVELTERRYAPTLGRTVAQAKTLLAKARGEPAKENLNNG